MAATELDIIREEQLRSNLLQAISSVETAIAVSTPGTRRVLENMLENVKKQLATLDKKIEETKVEYQAGQQARIVTMDLADKETALSASERNTYGTFLNEAFFTKTDFGQLKQFYAHSWDRLSEGGKDEMSHRVWEGIRHDEYRFSDLPKEMQEKEAKRLYGKLSNPSKIRDSLGAIPNGDRTDFVHAYEAGDQNETGQVLNRQSFRENVAVSTKNKETHGLADVGKKVDNDAAVTTVRNRTARGATPFVPTTTSGEFIDIKLDSLNLKDVTLVESNSPPSPGGFTVASTSRGYVRT